MVDTANQPELGAAPKIARPSFARDVSFAGGVVLRMRRAQGFELAAAEQIAQDAVGRIRAGELDLSQWGLEATLNINSRPNLLAGFLILIRAASLFEMIVESWNLVDDQDVPIPLTSKVAVAQWLNLGVTGASELAPFLIAAEGITPAEASEGNVSRPLPNGSGAGVSTIASSADPVPPPAPTESPA